MEGLSHSGKYILSALFTFPSLAPLTVNPPTFSSDLKSWELITQMKNSGLSEEDLLRVIEDAGVTDVNKIDIDDFEAIVVSLEEFGAV